MDVIVKRRYAALIFILATFYIVVWTIVAFAMGLSFLNPLATMTWLGWLIILANPAVIVGVAIWLKSIRDRKA
jgi:uncharacterized membrane protein